METTRLATVPCAYCGAELDAATGITGNSIPTPGDVTFCIVCGELLWFDEKLRPRKLTAQELIDLQHSPSWTVIERAYRVIREAIAARLSVPRGERKR